MDLIGNRAFSHILPVSCSTLDAKPTFGEWAFYAVYILDVLRAKPPVRNSGNRFVAQVHSATEFVAFDFDATVIHFVDKRFDRKRIRKLENGSLPGGKIANRPKIWENMELSAA